MTRKQEYLIIKLRKGRSGWNEASKRYNDLPLEKLRMHSTLVELEFNRNHYLYDKAGLEMYVYYIDFISGMIFSEEKEI